MSDRQRPRQALLSSMLRSVNSTGLPGTARPVGNSLGVGMVGNGGPSQPVLPPRRGSTGRGHVVAEEGAPAGGRVDAADAEKENEEGAMDVEAGGSG